VSSLIVILIATLIGGLVGYVGFWVRQNWDFSFHGSPVRGLMMSFGFAGQAVFRGTLVGALSGLLIAALAEIVPW
jgi:hypothetical protein